MAFKELPRNKDLDELWESGLLFSRSNPQMDWRADTPAAFPRQLPSQSGNAWTFAIQVED